ncbi:MAG: cytosolic protein [Bacteroidaceae bacterium]|nr:cytosolic protein [Bacteroidaceae bacterium]MBQ3538399.1 cytosolic protein [Bacteroidaceae bacterium]MBQ6693969.1 cytosolic protein [Bacteroidaceae bacterium]
MNQDLTDKVIQYVKENIHLFHESRIKKMETLKLRDFIKRKNPYLFKAKNITTAAEFVKNYADAYISSAEETMFGDWLEGLAVFVCSTVYNGRKSTTKGIDLEFDKDNIRYIISIKSGPYWGNSTQIAKMREDFKTAKKTLRTSKSGLNILAVNGCCYGIENNPDKGDYYKYCGQDFWYFISGEETLYQDIIEPLATDAKEKNETFSTEYGKMLNKITKEFIDEYCFEDGSIDWNKIVRINSASKI